VNKKAEAQNACHKGISEIVQLFLLYNCREMGSRLKIRVEFFKWDTWVWFLSKPSAAIFAANRAVI